MAENGVCGQKMQYIVLNGTKESYKSVMNAVFVSYDSENCFLFEYRNKTTFSIDIDKIEKLYPCEKLYWFLSNYSEVK